MFKVFYTNCSRHLLASRGCYGVRKLVDELVKLYFVNHFSFSTQIQRGHISIRTLKRLSRKLHLIRWQKHNLGRVGPICTKWNSWQWTDARKLMVTPSCNKEDVWYVIRHIIHHNKMAFQCASVTHLHREFCRGYSRCGSLSCNNNFRLFSQNRISILSSKFQLYSQNSQFFFLMWS